MKLDNMTAACLLVQAIDILGDNAVENTHLLEPGHDFMPSIGPAVNKREQLFDEHLPHLGRVSLKGAQGAVFKGVEAGPQTIGAAEIRNTAFGADTRTGQGNGLPAFFQHACGKFYCIIHRFPYLFCNSSIMTYNLLHITIIKCNMGKSKKLIKTSMKQRQKNGSFQKVTNQHI
jgi:hypothetical protein